MRTPGLVWSARQQWMSCHPPMLGDVGIRVLVAVVGRGTRRDVGAGRWQARCIGTRSGVVSDAGVAAGVAMEFRGAGHH